MKCKSCGITFNSSDGKPLCDNCREHYERELKGISNFLDNVKGREPTIRRDYLRPFIRDFFEEYRIDTPDCVFDDLADEWSVLMKSNNKSELKKALSAFKRYAEWYYNEHVGKVFLQRVSLNTIRKIIFKTWYGTRINSLGKGEATLDNIKKGFISEGVYDYLMDKVLVADPSDDLLGLWGEDKILYIREQIQKQKHKQDEEARRDV